MYSWIGPIVFVAAVVILTRCWVRRPTGVSVRDANGIRSTFLFDGDSPEFFEQDDPQSIFVGLALFTSLCDQLESTGYIVSDRGPMDAAQSGVCRNSDGVAIARIVLEWYEPRWVVSFDYYPTCAAHRRHIRYTHDVYAVPDTPEFRNLLKKFDRILQNDPRIQNVERQRKDVIG